MRHIFVISNPMKDPELEATNWVREKLNEEGISYEVHVQEDCHDGFYTDKKMIPEKTDCILVLGGDGTLLAVARDTAGLNIPLLGVNLGTLGYLAEVEKSHLPEALKRLCVGDYEIDKRMMLEGRATLQGSGAADGHSNLAGDALNDVVISRSGSLRVIHFKIYVNGHFLRDYSADGIIVSTPTGSTGYNMSAGGPIVEPGAKLIVLTPICPHTLNTRSIILAPEDRIEIEIAYGKSGEEQAVEANFDGSHSITMKTGDRIMIKRSEKTTSIIKLSDVSFLEVLHRKMGEYV